MCGIHHRLSPKWSPKFDLWSVFQSSLHTNYMLQFIIDLCAKLPCTASILSQKWYDYIMPRVGFEPGFEQDCCQCKATALSTQQPRLEKILQQWYHESNWVCKDNFPLNFPFSYFHIVPKSWTKLITNPKEMKQKSRCHIKKSFFMKTILPGTKGLIYSIN